ncbi:hypothetical protein ES703_122035 [subsurface metagenome]
MDGKGILVNRLYPVYDVPGRKINIRAWTRLGEISLSQYPVTAPLDVIGDDFPAVDRCPVLEVHPLAEMDDVGQGVRVLPALHAIALAVPEGDIRTGEVILTPVY